MLFYGLSVLGGFVNVIDECILMMWVIKLIGGIVDICGGSVVDECVGFVKLCGGGG